MGEGGDGCQEFHPRGKSLQKMCTRLKDLWDFLGIYGIYEIFGGFLGFFGIYGIFWDLWNFLGFMGFFWDLWDLFGIYGIFLGFFRKVYEIFLSDLPLANPHIQQSLETIFNRSNWFRAFLVTSS